MSLTKRSRIPLALLQIFFLTTGGLFAEDRYDWHALPASGEENAVLVLCPGMNSDGIHFLREEPWLRFADDHGLGVIAIHFSSDPDLMYGAERKGYYWPEQGSGEALLDAIRETYGEDLPIVVYGFSGGAHFVSRFVEWVPSRVVVWSAYSAQFWDEPSLDENTPPGIVRAASSMAHAGFPRSVIISRAGKRANPGRG